LRAPISSRRPSKEIVIFSSSRFESTVEFVREKCG
jgi:hypothetical protein